MSRIDNTVELFKSHGLVEWVHGRYIWTRKAHELASKNNYSIATNVTCDGNYSDVIWLQTVDSEYGFNWVNVDNEKYDDYVKMTLKVFDINIEDDIVPIDVEDIVL